MAFFHCKSSLTFFLSLIWIKQYARRICDFPHLLPQLDAGVPVLAGPLVVPAPPLAPAGGEAGGALAGGQLTDLVTGPESSNRLID